MYIYISQMAVMGLRIPLSCMLFAVLVVVCSAAHSAPAPAVDCSSLVLNMADCLSFVTAGSTTKKPDGTCCSGLKTVLKTDAECLCEAFRNSAQLGVTLNVSKAMTLPSACHVSAPSVSNCGLSVGTGAAPALSPSAVSPTSSEIAGVPTGSIVSNEVAPSPAPDVAHSGSSPVAASIGFLLTALSALSFTLF